MDKTWRVSQLAVLAALTLMFGGGAEAGAVRGTFHPDGDGFVPGYTGSALFEVDDTCYAGGPTFTGYEKVMGDCGPATLVSGEVFLYGTTGPATGTPLDSFTLEPGDLTVTGLRFVNGVVQGIDTDMGGVFHGSSVYSSFDLFLQFVTGCVATVGDLTVYDNCGAAPDMYQPTFVGVTPQDLIEQDLQQAILTRESCVPDEDVIIDVTNEQNCTTSSLFTELGALQFEAVPEPGTMGLILGALGGGWLARRRTKKALA